MTPTFSGEAPATRICCLCSVLLEEQNAGSPEEIFDKDVRDRHFDNKIITEAMEVDLKIKTWLIKKIHFTLSSAKPQHYGRVKI